MACTHTHKHTQGMVDENSSCPHNNHHSQSSLQQLTDRENLQVSGLTVKSTCSSYSLKYIKKEMFIWFSSILNNLNLNRGGKMSIETVMLNAISFLTKKNIISNSA